MHNAKAKILTAIILTTLTLSLIPFASASLGNILINDNDYPQNLPITPVPAGGNITLFFGNVTFSGSQLYLLLSQDGLSQVSTGDVRYTPLFNVASVAAAPSNVPADPLFPGTWVIGDNWINGSIPLSIAGGTYYIKAFDGATTALAVTQGFTVAASLKIIPTTGPAGASIIVSANAFPANSLLNLSYVSLNPLGNIVSIVNLTATDSLGRINYSMAAPDLKQVPPAGDAAPVTNIIKFSAIANGTTTVYEANYTETQRGLLQFGRPASAGVIGNIQNATGVYGNNTSFNLTPTAGINTVTVGVGDNLRIAGTGFFPGSLTMNWDGAVWGGTTASDTGKFNVTLPVPQTGLGSHNITITDSGLQVFQIYVDVAQSITISPTSGPIGTTVTVNGYGFPAAGSPAGYNYNVTIAFSGVTPSARTSAMTNSSGQFTATFDVPTGAAGGAHNITATANNTALTSAFKEFTVQAAFTLNPTSFYANSSNTAVVGTGTGADPATRYFVAIDNVFSPFTNTTNGIAPSSTGTLKFTFIGVGFSAGLHVVSLYQVGDGSGLNAPIANATFTVLTDPNDPLGSINKTVTSIKSDTSVIKDNVTTIVGWGPTIIGISNGVATIQSTLGTMTTTLSSIQATLSSVAGQVATISTSIGSMTSQLGTIDAKVTSIEGSIATINTALGTLQGTVTSIDGKVATIQTDIGTLTMDVANLQTSVDAIPNKVNIPIYIAAAFAIVAAIAAIMSLIMMRRKIAG